jgi:fucose 4-O-acetylase-like acetyltransferase
MSSSETNNKTRLPWVDTVKALGIFLVFYGHIVEGVCRSGSYVAYYQYKFIYSFHMPLFFFMAGFFWRPSTEIPKSFGRLALRRLVPVVAFSTLLFPVWLLSEKLSTQSIDLASVQHRIWDYRYGHPWFDWPTWFLICLFSCEILAISLLAFTRSKLAAAALGAAALMTGLLACQHATLLFAWAGIPPTFWFITEAVVALGFYSFGYVLFPSIKALAINKWSCGITAIMALIALTTTYSLNNPAPNFVVMMVGLSHGWTVPFLLSAAAGITFSIASVLSLPERVHLNPAVSFLGRNTVALLGLNGLFLHFLNRYALDALKPHNTYLYVTAYCLFGTLLSLGLCAPPIRLINKYAPWLVGATVTTNKLRIEKPYAPTETQARSISGLPPEAENGISAKVSIPH